MSKPTPVPNVNGFASQWNIGLTCVKFSGAFDEIIENMSILRVLALWEIFQMATYLYESLIPLSDQTGKGIEPRRKASIA